MVNISEAAKLLRFVSAVSPSQKMDEDTAQAWAAMLRDVDYGDAFEAARVHLLDDSYVEPKDIYRGVKAIRRKRIEAFGDFPTPPAERADGPEFHIWRAETTRDIADGTLTRDMVPVIPKGRRPPELSGMFHSVGE